ncbi:MAG: cytochrome P460 family protein [Thermodesulfobacteriota bacterium]
MRTLLAALACLLTLALASPGFASEKESPKKSEKKSEAREAGAKLPKNFREWAHTKSMVIPDKSHGLYGFHNIYANEKALKSLKGGDKYTEEAAFVVSFYEVVDEGGMVSQGAKIMDAVMIKDRKASATEGWVYAAFGPDGKALPIDPVKDCYECHTSVRDKDFVFHAYID